MHLWKGAKKLGSPPAPSFGQNPKEQQFFLRRLSLSRWLQQMVVVVILVRRRLVKICVNLACWEKVIDSEKLARAQRISQEPLSRGFQQASSPSHHLHLHLHLQDDLWSENLFLCSSRSLSIFLSLFLWETNTKTKTKEKNKDRDKGKTQRQRQQFESGCFEWEVHPHSKFKLASPSSSLSLSLRRKWKQLRIGTRYGSSAPPPKSLIIKSFVKKNFKTRSRA